MNYSKKFSTLMLFLLAFVSQISRAEDMEKTDLIVAKWEDGIAAYNLIVTEYYDFDFTVKGYDFILGAQNDKYSRLKDPFTVVSGSAQKIFDFTKWVLEFIKTCKIEKLTYPNKEYGISIEYYNWGGMLGKVYFIRKDSAYHVFKKSEIEKIQKKLLDYCKKHNIKVDTSVPVEINPALGEKH